MIIIIRGPRAPLARHGMPSDLTMRWDVSAEAASWGAMRAMSAQLRAALGDGAFEDALGRGDVSAPVVALSLVFPRLEARLGPAQRRARETLSGASLALSPGALARTTPVGRSWARVIATMVEGRAPLVVVPELDRVDLTTLRNARTLVASTRGGLSMLIGHDTHVAGFSPFEMWIRKLKVRELSRIEALPVTRVEQVDMRREPLLVRRGAAFEERESKTIETMRAAFASYAFDAALRVALELSARLEGAELREAHALAALSATRLDPHARGEDFGVGVAEAGFLGALGGESDPAKRARWSLELALLYARARGEVEPSLARADAAVADAEAAGAGYLEAWARYARACARRQAGQAAEAAADLDAALARLDDGAVLRDTSRARLDGARALFANDRARLADALGRRDDLDQFRRLVEASLAALPPEERPGYDWIIPVDDELAPSAARAHHGAELARARAVFEPEDEAAAARALAGAELCIGDAASAVDLLEEAARVTTVTGGTGDDLFALRIERLVAAMRARLWGEAERDLDVVRADPRCEGDVAQAEALAIESLIAAGKGDLSTLDASSASALASAQAIGAPGVAVRVGKLAADANLLAGRAADARRFAEIARAALTEKSAPDEVLGVLVTLLECGAGDGALVAEAVEHARDALGTVAAWWELPRLLPHVIDRIAQDPRAIDAGALAALVSAAAQRPDCEAFVARLREMGV